MATGVQFSGARSSITPLSQLESLTLISREDEATQITAQRVLTESLFCLFIGAMMGGVFGSFCGSIGLLKDTGTKVFVPAIFSCVIGSGLGGAAARITLYFLKKTTPTSGIKGIIGAAGGALIGGSLALASFVNQEGIPFTEGTSVGEFFKYMGLLGGLAVLLGGGLSYRGGDYYTCIFAGTGIGCIIGIGIGAWLGAAVGLTLMGILLESMAGLAVPPGLLIGFCLTPNAHYEAMGRTT
ncbi:MAG TPA: hypothetical protein VMR37_07525 [Rhabdochlamydiaceae bacterium]|nr:hypothetical protein [Rhabdochlamydiaceae bacterium]